MNFFDSHAHYDDEKFNIDRDKVIPEIYNSGITKFVSAGYSLKGSMDALNLAKKYDYIYTILGISPNDLNENWRADVEEIDKILEKEMCVEKNNQNRDIAEVKDKINNTNKTENKSNSKIVAVGEIGLDYHYDTNKDWQKEAFIMQIKMANKYNLPIVIHTREATIDTINILKENEVIKKGVFHCCPFNRELIKEALKLGFYISIAGPVTFKNSKNAEEIVNMIPLDKMLIETDSPYLAPEPVRGTRNDSRNVKYIAKQIADFRGVSLEEIANITYKNAMEVFSIN